MAEDVVLVCGPDPHDPGGLYHLDRELGGDDRARVFAGRAPDGLRVAVRIGTPSGEGAVRHFRSPPPWAPGREPTGALVPVQIFELVDELARVVHDTDAGLAGVRWSAAARALPPTEDPERDPAFRAATARAAANAARPPARIESAPAARWSCR